MRYEVLNQFEIGGFELITMICNCSIYYSVRGNIRSGNVTHFIIMLLISGYLKQRVQLYMHDKPKNLFYYSIIFIHINAKVPPPKM